MSVYLKDPMARLDYAIDWAGGYLAQGESIAASSWSVRPEEPGGLGIEAETLTGSLAAVTVSGGTAGRSYRLSNSVTLTNGLSDERSILIRVDDSQ